MKFVKNDKKREAVEHTTQQSNAREAAQATQETVSLNSQPSVTTTSFQPRKKLQVNQASRVSTPVVIKGGVNFISVSKLRAVIGNQARASNSVPQAASVPHTASVPPAVVSRPTASKPAYSKPPFKPPGRTMSTRSSKSATSFKTIRR
ncbi:hypothetical protein Salat_0671600 [Sesamum alatum]|uniref:Uncharacterized protein n=1 Tax=Sesamum alatum TaxID=300844 RepID=A0AAE1YS81_9LAMI|nr:hypothetical protein Salat_0671600 [Sesamum alatum]